MVKKRHGLMKYILVVVVALAIVLGVKFFAGREAISYTVPVPAVTVALPVVGTMEESLTINGHVEARSMIPVIPSSAILSIFGVCAASRGVLFPNSLIGRSPIPSIIKIRPFINIT